MADLGIDPKYLGKRRPKTQLYREKFADRKIKYNPIVKEILELDKNSSKVIGTGWRGKQQKKIISDLVKKYGKGGLNVEDFHGLLNQMERSRDPEIRKYFRRRDVRELAKSFGIERINKRRHRLDKYSDKKIKNKSQSNQLGQKYSVGGHSRDTYSGSRAQKGTEDRISRVLKKSGNNKTTKNDPYANIGKVSGTRTNSGRRSSGQSRTNLRGSLK